MELHEHEVNGVTVLEVKGRIDSTTASKFGTSIEAASTAPHSRLLLDLGQLEYISSAGFRVLYLAAKRTSETERKFAICALSERVHELFSIAGFLKHFKILPTRQEGIAALQ
jgi:anti-anti-sigma factor